MQKSKVYFYPVWLRLWHWLNALLFLFLIFTGLNMQYANAQTSLINFKTAISVHNVSGVMLTLNYIFFFMFNIISGNYKQYIPKMKGLIRRLYIQTKFYLSGIFRNEAHPFETDINHKFNPLQQITYLKIMYVAFPVLILSGWALLFPEFIVDKIFNVPGLLLTDLVHTIMGFILSLFMIGHVYLATTGTTVMSNFKSMITGIH